MKIPKSLLIILCVILISNSTNSFGAHDSDFEAGWTTVPTKAAQIAVAVAKRDARERAAAARAHEAAEYERLTSSLAVAKTNFDQEISSLNQTLLQRDSARRTKRLDTIYMKISNADIAIRDLQSKLSTLSASRPDLAAGSSAACPDVDRLFAEAYAEIKKMELARLSDTRQYRPGKQPSKKPRKRI